MEQFLARGNSGENAIKILLEENAQQRELIESLTKIAFTDSLTGLLNRAGYEKVIHDHFGESRANQKKREHQNGHIVFMFVDLDGFKAINDTYGHKAGDIALQEVGKYLAAQVRESDIVLARKGGDEFLSILQGTDKNHADQRIAEIENGLNSISFEYNGETIKVGGSIGAIDYNPAFTIEQNVAFADSAMMERKGGKRRGAALAELTADDFNRANSKPENTTVNGQPVTTAHVTKFDPLVRTRFPF